MSDPSHGELCDVHVADTTMGGTSASPDSARDTVRAKGKTRRFSGAFWNVVVQSCYPVLVVIVLLVDWLIATVCLGRPPVPARDDPTLIPALMVSGLYHGTLILLLAAPGSFLVALVAAPIAFAQLVRRRDLLLQAKLLPLLLPLVCWSFFLAVIVVDPLQVVRWILR